MKKELARTITLGLLMGLSTSAFLTNSVVYATEPTKDTITIDISQDDPIISSQDYTNVDEQYIEGDSLGKKYSTVTQTGDLSGIIASDGQNVEIKFNKLQFDIVEKPSYTSTATHVIT